MSAVLGVLACAGLFVAFGLLHRRGRPRIGCDACAGSACVSDCPWKSVARETTDATR
jgi:hypothetical protein